MALMRTESAPGRVSSEFKALDGQGRRRRSVSKPKPPTRIARQAQIVQSLNR